MVTSIFLHILSTIVVYGSNATTPTPAQFHLQTQGAQQLIPLIKCGDKKIEHNSNKHLMTGSEKNS